MRNNSQDVFKHFQKLLEIKRNNQLLKISRYANFRTNIEILSSKILRTIYEMKKKLISNNDLFYSRESVVKARLIILMTTSTTKNISVINKFVENYQIGDYVIVISSGEAKNKEFQKQLQAYFKKEIKIESVYSFANKANFNFASLLERIIRQMILIEQKVGSAYLIASSKTTTTFARIAPLYSDESDLLQEVVQGSAKDEDVITNFSLSRQSWLSFSIANLITLRILLNLLNIDILELNNQLIATNQNLDILETKIQESVLNDLKAKRRKMMDEDSILNN